MSREKLKALEELQKVDLKIRDLEAEAEKHPARLRQIETERGQAKTALDATAASWPTTSAPAARTSSCSGSSATR